MGSATALALLSFLVAPVAGGPAAAVTLPSGFQEQIVYAGLTRPTNVEFSPDGRVFVAEQRGVIKVFDDLADATATTFADLRAVVHDNWDRGMLGLALHPAFPAEPWVYVLYAYDAPPGGTAPFYNDDCNTVSGGANGGRCVVTARLSRLQAAGNQMTGAEQVLIHDWCQQYPSHSIGNVRFGADGALYVTGGDGASFSTTDYGQLPSGGPINPCGDPPGGSMQPPTAEGGALRSQDIRTTADPTTLGGAILRLDPATGAALPDNPLIGSPDLNARRIVAHGLRNPYRFTIRPGTSEVWVGDVGWSQWEEINRLANPTGGLVNFGWPCYEGAGQMASYANANLNLCSSLYSAGGHTAPYFTYRHANQVGTGCPTGSSSITGLAFYPQAGGPYPADYHGALFFADYSRRCIWVMKPATPGGLPSTSAISTFGADAAGPVELEIGPGGELYYADLGGTVRRIRYFPGNQPPTAAIDAVPTSGAAPLTVTFDGTASTDPDPADAGLLTYAWDFTDDGTVDATTPTAMFTYADAGVHTARLTVTDTLGGSDSATVPINVGNSVPTAVMETPAAGLTWAVGDQIGFSGSATDPQDGPLPATALSWALRMQHCFTPDNCHVHNLQTWDGVASGSFIAPDHEYPSWLELALTARDSGGQTHTVVRELQPKTVNLTVASDPPGLTLSLGPTTATAPFTRTVIQGSANTISAPSPQTLGGTGYAFTGWAHGGGQTQVITAPATATTYTAGYAATAPVNVALNRPATADSQCNSAEGPEKAVNGSWTGGRSDKWCSLGLIKWWQVDLGSARTVDRVVIRHAGAGGENRRWNTRAFNLQVSTDGLLWTTVANVTGNTQDVTTHTFAAATARYVRLNVITPTSNGNRAARIYEVEVYAVP
jgi:glucose/arabinose dehydrogenase